MQSKPTLNAIKLAFLHKRTNIAGWARKNEFDYKATVKILHRYTEKQQIPQSPFVYDVLIQLNSDTGINLMDTENQGGTKC